MDLSLFATSPSDGRPFATSYISPTHRGTEDISCYHAQRQLNLSQQRNYTMKTLPPLPRKKLCRRRSQTRRCEPASQCILDRLKRTRTHDQSGAQRPTLQQRRNHTTTPVLTLSIPTSTGQEGRGARRERVPRPTMVWMPDDQMWLIQDHTPFNSNSHVRSYIPPPNRVAYRYTRSEPSPEPSALFDLAPLSPFQREPVQRDEEPPDEIRNQFLRLMRPEEDERLSSLFQEAIQSVPPMTATSPQTPHPTYPIDDDWVYRQSRHDEEDSCTEASAYDSYHTAYASPLGEETRSIYSQISRENPWAPQDPDDSNLRSPEDEPTSVVSQMSQENSWRDDHRNGFSPLSCETPWTAMAWSMGRPRSTTN